MEPVRPVENSVIMLTRRRGQTHVAGFISSIVNYTIVKDAS